MWPKLNVLLQLFLPFLPLSLLFVQNKTLSACLVHSVFNFATKFFTVMAFMVPVMKNNYEIYKDTRLRKKSECSNASSSIDGTTLGASMAAPIAKNEHRTWESCSSTPCRTKRAQMQRSFSQKIPRNTYKSSQGEDLGAVSPTRSFCQTRASPSTSPNEMSVTTNPQITCSENGISKFHRRLVDKLCKSLRRDGIKES